MNEEEQATIRRAAEALCSRAGCLCFLLVIYGIYRMFGSGLSSGHKLYTYVPITLGVLGSFGATFYGLTLRSKELGWGIAASKFAGLLPYATGMYMVLFLGLYGLFTLTTEFRSSTLLRSLFFIVFGYKCLFYFWAATEMDKEYFGKPKGLKS